MMKGFEENAQQKRKKPPVMQKAVSDLPKHSGEDTMMAKHQGLQPQSALPGNKNDKLSSIQRVTRDVESNISNILN